MWSSIHHSLREAGRAVLGSLNAGPKPGGRLKARPYGARLPPFFMISAKARKRFASAGVFVAAASFSRRAANVLSWAALAWSMAERRDATLCAIRALLRASWSR